MIWELLIKTFIPVSRIFGNEDDIFIYFIYTLSIKLILKVSQSAGAYEGICLGGGTIFRSLPLGNIVPPP